METRGKKRGREKEQDWREYDDELWENEEGSECWILLSLPLFQTFFESRQNGTSQRVVNCSEIDGLKEGEGEGGGITWQNYEPFFLVVNIV